MTIQQVYGGRDRTPGVSAAIETAENEFVFGPWGAQYISGLQIDGAARDVGNTGNTHILRSGLLLGQVTATKKLKEWSPTAQDGTEYIWGILKEARSMLTNNTNTNRLTGNIMVAGGLLANKIIIPGTTALGIVGNTLEMLVRQQLRTRFHLNDSMTLARPEWFIHNVSAAEQAAGIILTTVDSHRAYHTDAAVTITLPDTPYKGLTYEFYGEGAAITVSSASANIKVPGAVSPLTNSLSVEDEIQQLTGTGTQWLVKTF